MTRYTLFRMLKDQRGATVIEYGVLVAGLGVAIVGVVLALGVDVAALFGRTGSTVAVSSGRSSPAMRVVALQTFATGREGWTGGELRTLPQIGTGLSLAGPQTGGREMLRRTFDIPDGATRAEISFDMSFVDSWDNEQARIYLNGKKIGTGSFQWNRGEPSLTFTPDAGITATAQLTSTVRAGTWAGGGADHTYTVKLVVDDPGSSLTLGFGTTLNQSKVDESLLIGNVKVSANR